MTRWFTTVLAMVATILLIAGCAGAAPAPTAAPAPKPAAPTAAPKAAEPTKAPAAAPTKAPEPTKPAAAAPAKKVDWPDKGRSITMIANYAPGGTVDVYSRVLAPFLEKELGIAVAVANKAGASGLVGNTDLARARPDGYTIGNMSAPDNIVCYMDPEYNATFKRDAYAPVSNIMSDYGTLAVHKDSPFKTLKDLVDAAKAKPEGIKVGTYGVKSKGHLQVLGFQKLAGVKFAVVQFDGGGPTMTALAGQHIDVASVNMGATMAQLKSGNVRLLGAMGPQANPLFPDVPTFRSQGYDAIYPVYQGQMVPAATPKEIVDVLDGAIKKILATDDFKKKLADVGQNAHYMGPKEWGDIWAQHEKEVVELLKLAAEETKK